MAMRNICAMLPLGATRVIAVGTCTVRPASSVKDVTEASAGAEELAVADAALAVGAGADSEAFTSITSVAALAVVAAVSVLLAQPTSAKAIVRAKAIAVKLFFIVVVLL
jgi:hypothetical protein